MTVEVAADAPPNPLPTPMQDFLIQRELAEVYLLLDNVASVRAKSIPSMTDNSKVFDTDRDWLEEICEIRWPTDPKVDRSEARRAAQLLHAKDLLNEAASPATGASIAFTTLISSHASWFGDFTRAFGKANDKGDDDAKLTRDSLAAQAYPNLVEVAPAYARLRRGLGWFLMAWLALTCTFSWDVATGSALLNRVYQLQEQSASQALVTGNVVVPPNSDTATNDGKNPTAASKGNTSAAANESTAAASSVSSGVVSQTSENSGAATNPDSANSERDRLSRQRYANAQLNLKHWLDADYWLRGVLQATMGGIQETSFTVISTKQSEATDSDGRVTAKSGSTIGPANIASNPDDKPAEKIINVEWAAVFINILAGTILPICYGVLGATASVVRTISTKLRDFTLMPRDLMLSPVQIALGAVIGACIGLFVSSDGGTGASAGLIGSVHLSQSALCFVAGFGVEGVFQALEELVRRVFNIDIEKQAPKTAA